MGIDWTGRWSVEVLGHDADAALLRAEFDGDDCRVVDNGGRAFLLSSSFDRLTEGADVARVGSELLAMVNGFMLTVHAGDFRPVTLGHVYRGDPLGRSDVHILVAESINIELRGYAATLVVTGPDGAVQPTPAPQGPAAVRLALGDTDVRDVLRFLSVLKPNTFELYKAYEVIGRSRILTQKWASEDEVSAFTGSLNRPDVLGDGARHARSSPKPQKKTMTLPDAIRFMRRITREYVRWRLAGNK